MKISRVEACRILEVDVRHSPFGTLAPVAQTGASKCNLEQRNDRMPPFARAGDSQPWTHSLLELSAFHPRSHPLERITSASEGSGPSHRLTVQNSPALTLQEDAEEIVIRRAYKTLALQWCILSLSVPPPSHPPTYPPPRPAPPHPIKVTGKQALTATCKECFANSSGIRSNDRHD